MLGKARFSIYGAGRSASDFCRVLFAASCWPGWELWMDAEFEARRATELLADMAWLSRLAQRMVRDPALADDAVQEAWMAAKRRLVAAGAEGGPDRGLLARTLRGVVLQARRASRRRRYHEQRSELDRDAGKALPSTAELLSIGESQQILWKHLSRLEEPFRTSLLLRYQQGLDTGVLAQRLGIRPDSVRWRLRRGLALLRDSLEREDQGPGLLAMVPMAALGLPLRPAIPLASATATGVSAGHLAVAPLATKLGVTWMTHKTLLAAVVVAVAVFGSLWWLPGQHRSAAPGQASGPLAKAQGTAQHAPRSARIAEDPDALASTADLDLRRIPGAGAKGNAQAPLALAAGRLVDPRGQPVDGAPIVLRLPGQWSRECTSQPDGRFEVACPMEPRQTVLLHIPASGLHRSTYRSLGAADDCTLPPLSEKRVELGDIELLDGGLLRGRLVDETGRPVAGAKVDAKPRRYRNPVHSQDDGRFELPGLQLGENLLIVEGLQHRNTFVPIQLEPGVPLDLGDVLLATRPKLLIRGFVHDADGQPIALARVQSRSAVELTGPDGAFSLRSWTTGRDNGSERARVWVEAEGYRQSLAIWCEDASEPTFVLHPLGAQLHFQVLDETTAEPIQGATLSIAEHSEQGGLALGSPEPRKARAPGSEDEASKADGRLTVQGLVGIDRITVAAQGYEARKLPLDGSAGKQTERVVRLRPTPRGTLRGVIPADLLSDPSVRLEIQDIQRLHRLGPSAGGRPYESAAALHDPAGSQPEIEWIAPPLAARGSSESLQRWIDEDPTLRVTGQHRVPIASNGGFEASSRCSSLHRAVLRWSGGGVAISNPIWIESGETEAVRQWRRTTLGSLQGRVILPHPDLASALRLRLAGSDQDPIPVGASGEFRADDLTPGHYFLEPESLPDGFPKTPFRRTVEVLPGSPTHVEIDPDLPPFGAVEFSLTLNGQPHPHGFAVRLLDEHGDYLEYSDWSPGDNVHMLVPAKDGYRVSIEPELPDQDNTGHELPRSIDVHPGSQRIDLQVASTHLVCALGPRHHKDLGNTWQVLLWKDAQGRERPPIEAGVHVYTQVQASATSQAIRLGFPHVPADARDLRLLLSRRDDDTVQALIPLAVELKAGTTIEVAVD